VPGPATEVPDGWLAASAASGDGEAFDELVRRHQPRLLKLAGRFFRRPEVVEEVVQEAFLKAYTSLDGFRGERPFGHWLTRITVNASYDQLRRQRARPETALDEASVLDLLASPDGSESELARITAEQLLTRLAPEERLVLTLTVLEELPVRDVARLTGWSIPNVKVRAFRARRKLRRALGGVT
jgi:RNA polymerase sigma-70 factor (ECF subfamily)